MQQKTTDKLVRVAKIINLHGVKGVVKIKLFIENDALFNKFDIILDGKTTPIPVKLLKKVKDHWLAEIEGVNDCDAAEVLKNKELFVNRASFPELEEDEYIYLIC